MDRHGPARGGARLLTFTQGGAGRDFSGFTAEGTDERLRWVRGTAGARFADLELSALVQRVLQSRRARWGLSYYVVFEPAMEAFAPVVARLAGT